MHPPQGDAGTVISAQGLSNRYGSTVAVSDLSFEVTDGGVYFFVVVAIVLADGRDA